MRKVFLEDLPRKGGTQGKINWINSIGFKINGIYDDMEFEVEIVDYKSEKHILYIKHKGEKVFNIYTGNFQKCKFGKLLDKITDDLKVGDTLKNEKRDLTITDTKHKLENNNQNKKYYKYKCNKCGFDEGWIAESSLIRGSGCGCCNGKVVMEYINSIVAKEETHWMIPYFQGGYDEAKKYTPQSSQKITPICPDCGRIKNKEMYIDTIHKTKSIGCNCRDSTSYPEKFMFSVLKQLNVEFQTQLSKTTFDWCKDYKYDFYIPSLNTIIEIHGEQHYKQTRRKGARNIQEEQENDRLKKELALKNGIKEENYIVIDCRKSELEYIKDKILNSNLFELFNLSNIDWNQSEEFSLSNRVKEACELKRDNPNMTTTEIGKQMGLECQTIIGYLKKGSQIWNWINYDAKIEKSRVSKNNGKLNGKLVEVFKDEISLGVFESSHELERQSEEIFGVKLCQGTISKVCLNKQLQYKGFTFKYVDKLNNFILAP